MVYSIDAQLAKDLSKDDVERVIVQLILDGILVAYSDPSFVLFECKLEWTWMLICEGLLTYHWQSYIFPDCISRAILD